MSQDLEQHHLCNVLADSLTARAGSSMHKRVAGPTEGHQILKHIVNGSPPVADVVDVQALVGCAAPATAVMITRKDGLPEPLRQAVVAHGRQPFIMIGSLAAS